MREQLIQRLRNHKNALAAVKFNMNQEILEKQGQNRNNQEQNRDMLPQYRDWLLDLSWRRLEDILPRRLRSWLLMGLLLRGL